MATLKGQIQGKNSCGQPRTMFLDWLLKTEELDPLEASVLGGKTPAPDGQVWYGIVEFNVPLDTFRVCHFGDGGPEQ